jgi:hypothetical protein
MLKRRFPQVLLLTLIMQRRSMWSEMVRDDCKIKKSSELLQREIRQFV